MKATLEFNLPEEQEEYNMYVKAPDYLGVLYELACQIRTKTKHGDPDATLTWDELKEMFWQECQARDIDPYGG